MFAWRDSSRRGLARRLRRASVAVARVAFARVVARVVASSRAPRVASRASSRERSAARARAGGGPINHAQYDTTGDFRSKMPRAINRGFCARCRAPARRRSRVVDPPFSDARPSVDTMGVRLATLDARRDALDARSTRAADLASRARRATTTTTRRERDARALSPRARRRGRRRCASARRRPPTRETSENVEEILTNRARVVRSIGLQVCGRTLEEEAIRCDALLAADSRVGVPAVAVHLPRDATDATG